MSYEFENLENGEVEIHYTGDGWVSTTTTKEKAELFKKGELSFTDFEWE